MGEAGWRSRPATTRLRHRHLKKFFPGRASYRGRKFEHLSFESGYEPWPEEPGRKRWLSYAANRTAHAWVLRHPGGPRPWLVGLHGIRMGSPEGGKFFLYRPDFLHEELGLQPRSARAAHPRPPEGRGRERRPHPLRRRYGLGPRRGPGHVGHPASSLLAPAAGAERSRDRRARILPGRLHGSPPRQPGRTISTAWPSPTRR